MTAKQLPALIDEIWENRANLSPANAGHARKPVEEALAGLATGNLRVAEKGADGRWVTHQWLKKAVLLYFRITDAEIIEGGPGKSHWFDKVPSKFEGWNKMRFDLAGFRAVPNCVVRYSAYI